MGVAFEPSQSEQQRFEREHPVGVLVDQLEGITDRLELAKHDVERGAGGRRTELRFDVRVAHRGGPSREDTEEVAVPGHDDVERRLDLAPGEGLGQGRDLGGGGLRKAAETLQQAGPLDRKSVV